MANNGMIVVTYIRSITATQKRELDYISVDNIESFIEWFFNQGSRFNINLVDTDKILTSTGWIPNPQPSIPVANILQALDDTLDMVITVQKIVSDDGILFEYIKHCSQQIVRHMALKYVKA